MDAGKRPAQLVFGLDIGTRSIVGTVGYKAGDNFVVVAQAVREHKTRAMLDGQIHDISQVAATISEVKEELEEILGDELTEVCIAAAGRVLKTVEVHVDQSFEENVNLTKEEVYSLETAGVEAAYDKFSEENDDSDIKFYCVGYTVMRYYMNDYPIGNLEDHKAKKIGADMIATFLPDDVVDGLYKAVEMADLQVVNLTLEPIAAIQVAIPQMYRMLNIALVDVGAGTSDISITKDGAIVAYGMIPAAGDGLTEAIAAYCLVDFTTAEEIKRGIVKESSVNYKDIMGITQKISKDEVLKIAEPIIDNMASLVADKIKELNGGKSVSAVFIVGGGGKIEGYDKALARHLDIVPERVAVRGEEVMGSIEFQQKDIRKDSTLVTPIGICLSYYTQSNSFIYVTFNHQRVKLYDNSHLAVVDAALQANFTNYDLFPKRGPELHYVLNDKEKTQRGSLGEAAQIKINGVEGDITTPVHASDVIEVKASTVGEAAKLRIGELPEYHSNISVNVSGKEVKLPRYATVNGELQSEAYVIRENDKVEITNYYTVSQLMKFMDLPQDGTFALMINHEKAGKNTKVYENFSVEVVNVQDDWKEYYGDDEEDNDSKSEYSLNIIDESKTSDSDNDTDIKKDSNASEAVNASASASSPSNNSEGERAASGNASKGIITVYVNGSPVALSGKNEFIFVDVFDYIDFDLSTPKGKSVVTKLNGNKASYVDVLSEGDKLDIFWSQE
ncbi:MAG: rod shape-determining protein [Lachnospiraceae bacterium]|nr:rod shape-determining protein [Candidatus Merdinaster equi]